MDLLRVRLASTGELFVYRRGATGEELGIILDWEDPDRAEKLEAELQIAEHWAEVHYEK